MKFNLLRGGGRALASAAASLVDDEPVTSGPAAAEPAVEPETPVEPAAEPESEPESLAEPETPSEPEAPVAPAEDTITAARAEERQRVTDVFASDVSTGKERAAASLLANPKLSADDIIGLLPQMSGGETNQMLADLSATPNPDLKPGAEAKGDEKSGISVWDRVRGRTNG